MTIRVMEAEYFHAERHEEAKSGFRNSANAPKR
jgi:hypothetical protein